MGRGPYITRSIVISAAVGEAYTVVPKDIVVYSRDELEHWRGSINHLLARTFREGKVLYERS